MIMFLFKWSKWHLSQVDVDGADDRHDYTIPIINLSLDENYYSYESCDAFLRHNFPLQLNRQATSYGAFANKTKMVRNFVISACEVIQRPCFFG